MAIIETPIGESDLKQFQDFFYLQTGIVFGSGKRYFVERRLRDRMRALQEESVRGYLHRLKQPDGLVEMQLLINSMTVNEAYFFRETYQFSCLVDNLIPEIIQDRNRKKISIWSFPCSTGEEPYSIALWLLENWAGVDDYGINILGSDIDTKTLEQARAGLYNARSVQNLPKSMLARYFEPVSNGYWRVIGDLRNSIDFSCVNLMDRLQMQSHRDFDVIFCRNVLIYFDDASRSAAAEALFDALRPGGFLCLGHSDSLSRVSELFVVRRFAECVVYQKSKEAR